MKTSEFKNKASSFGLTTSSKYLSNEIDVIYDSDIIAKIDDKVRYKVTIYSTKHITDGIMDLIIEYAKTPIEDREEPKLYTARLKALGDIHTRYLNLNKDTEEYGVSTTTKIGSRVYRLTQKELEDVNGINVFESDEWVVEEVAE